MNFALPKGAFTSAEHVVIGSATALTDTFGAFSVELTDDKTYTVSVVESNRAIYTAEIYIPAGITPITLEAAHAVTVPNSGAIEAQRALNTHIAATDPHPQYVTDTVLAAELIAIGAPQIAALAVASDTHTAQLTTLATQVTALNDLADALLLYDLVLNGRVVVLESGLPAEVTRALAAENVLTTDLAAETNRATAAENSINASLGLKATDAALQAEIARAQAAESGLSTSVAAKADSSALASYAPLATANTFASGQGVRAAASGVAAGVYAPWVTGDTLPAIVGGTTSGNQPGVRGISSTSSGVNGSSATGAGVAGTSTSGAAVTGISTSGLGVSAATATNVAIQGVVNPTSGNAVVPALQLIAAHATPAAGLGVSMLLYMPVNTGTNRIAGRLQAKWNTTADLTDSTRCGTVELQAVDFAASRALIAGRANGTAAEIGVLGATPVVRQSVTGSRSSGAAWTSILAALVAFGWVADNTTA